MDKDRIFRVAVEDDQSFKDEMRRCGICYAITDVVPNIEGGTYNFYYVYMDEYWLIHPNNVKENQYKCWEDYL